MECIEARALKKSTFLSELAVNSSRESLIEEFVFVNGVNNDDFSVDGFFDFSNEDFKEEEENLSLSTSEEREDEGSDTWQFSCAAQSEDFKEEEKNLSLSVPIDEMENLEWLSQIVDDSASELSLLCPAGTFIPKTGFEPPVRTHSPVLCFPSTVPAKARTKRPRTGGRSWSGGSPESSGDCSPTSTLIFSNPAQTGWPVCATAQTGWYHHPVCGGFEPDSSSEEVMKPSPASKKGRKRPAAAAGGADSEFAPPVMLRRCSHCQVQKTPQWRNGPLGPKTLCNACGVRFKSGRLFPEYRPACSPTYLGDVHSNSHRKVLEMRRKKEVGLV